MSSSVQNPSATTVLRMSSTVTATGSSSVVGVPSISSGAGDLLAAQQRDRDLGGPLGLRLDRLVDGHVLIAREDPLDRGELGILSGHDRPAATTLAALSAETAPLAVPSFAAYTPTMSSPYCAIWPVTHSCALSGLQSGVAYSARIAQPGLVDHAVRTLGEAGRVAVGGRAVDHQDAAAGVAALFQRLDERGRLQLSDLLVVERDVVREVAAGDQTVVRHDRHALRVRRGDDRDGGAATSTGSSTRTPAPAARADSACCCCFAAS